MKKEMERQSVRSSVRSLTSTSKLVSKILIFLGAGSDNILSDDDPASEFTLVGIRSILTSWTDDQVLDALLKAVDGTIDFKYQLFNKPISASYIAGLMAAYRKYQKSLPVKVRNVLPEHIPTDKELQQLSLKTLYGEFDSYKRTG